MAAYSVSGPSTSGTGPATIAGVTSASTVRPRIYDMMLGNAQTPVNQNMGVQLQRYTNPGTATAFTPVACDPADPAALSAGIITSTVEPTYTANAFLLRAGMNQQGTIRWIAQPGSELVMPATASNGIGLLIPATVPVSAVVMTGTLWFSE